MVTGAALDRVVAPLFVPATRLDRVASAMRSGADAIILDLEDAVGPADKVGAREALASFDLPPFPIVLRINDGSTCWYEDDIAMARRRGFAGVMVPKSESAAALSAARNALGNIGLLPLVETVRGINDVRTIAQAEGVLRLVFGSVDFCADVGCAHVPDTLLFARTQLVMASRLSGLPSPIDGVTLAIEDDSTSEGDARRAASLGFGAKLCIHPRQIAPVLRGFAPTAAEIEWAAKVLAAADKGAVRVGQVMIDTPVRRRAEQISSRAALIQELAG